MRVIEYTKGRYDVQEIDFGKVYRWCPDSVVVECDCGEKLVLQRSETTCHGCCTDHADTVREKLAARKLEDADMHPWRCAEDREDAGLPC